MAATGRVPLHDAELQAIAEAAARALRAPLATLSIVNPGSEWIRASVGVPKTVVSREHSLAVVVHEDRKSWYPSQIGATPRFAENPAVLAGASSAGIEPVQSEETGAVLAALAVYRRDDIPFTEEERATLADLARQAAGVLESEIRAARMDTLRPVLDAVKEQRLRETAAFPLQQLSGPTRTARLVTRFWPWVAAAGLALTSLFTFFSDASVERLERRGLQRTAVSLEATVRERLASLVARIGNDVGLLEASDRIPMGWHRLLLSLDPSSRASGRVTVGYAAYVPADDASRFEEQARLRVSPQFAIKPRGIRPQAAPVVFYDPPAEDNGNVGFDLLTDETLRAAIEQARDSGRPYLSDRTSFGRSQGAGPTLVLFLPVYQGEPQTQDERRAAVRGFVVAPVAQAQLLPAPAQGGDDADLASFSIYSGDANGYENMLFGSSATPLVPDGNSVLRSFVIAGRRLSIVVAAPTAGGSHWLGVAALWLPLAAGLLATLFATLHYRNPRAQSGKHRTPHGARTSHDASDTSVRALVDHVIEAIITFDDKGIVKTYNRAAEAMFGYPPSLALNTRVDRLLPRESERQHFVTGRSELTAMHANGQPFVADVSVVNVDDAHPPMFVALISDITDARAAEKQLSAQMALTRVLAESTPLERAAVAIIRSVAQGMDAPAGALWLVNSSGEQLDRFASWALASGDERGLEDPRPRLPGRGLPGRVWITAQPSRIVDRRTLGSDAQSTVTLTSRLAFPLFGKNGVVGVLEFVTPDFDQVLARMEAMTGIIGREVGQFIERKRTEAALVESEARYRELFETAHDLIQSADERGRLLFANRAWRDTLGYSPAEIATLSIGDVMTPQSLETWNRALESAPNEGASLRAGVVFLTRGGEQILAEGSLTSRQVRGIATTLGIFRNVSAQREVERSKHEFVSTVSHELRTPLASIQGSLGLLAAGAMGDLPPDAGEVVAIAERNVVRLLRLVNDILDLERLQSGQLAMSLEPTLASAIVARSIETVQGFAEQREVRINVLAADGEAFIDAERVVQVLVNLLSNAAKFSPRESAIEVTAAESAGWVRISVRDDGPGISPVNHGAVFERFRQVTSTERLPSGGTGLGLAISKTIVEAHGGAIGIASDEGEGRGGSLFWFRVPAVRVNLDDRARHCAAAAPISAF